MIQFKRGKTNSWKNQKLADGQPGYDKEKHKIKIGDGSKLWQDLPYASGLNREDILNSESAAKIRHSKDPEDGALFTYGTEAPTNENIGEVYLQYIESESEPETDYVVLNGIDGIWHYQKWHSGYATCWGRYTLENAAIQESLNDNNLYYNKSMTTINYPITFTSIPCEIATIQSPAGMVWLTSREANTESHSGLYNLISPDEQTSATYYIDFKVEGCWKEQE
jgi:hypothetical protein